MKWQQQKSHPSSHQPVLERIRQAQDIVKHGTFAELCDLLLYADAFIAVAREKRASEAAREAARVRIEAARKLGQLLEQATTQEARDKLDEIVPNRFSRCSEVARIPQRLFNQVITELIDKDSACTIPTVIRTARIKTLTMVEPEIYKAYDESIWIKPKGKPQSLTHIHYGGIEAARRKLGLHKHPGATRIDDAYSASRILAHQLSSLTSKLTSDARKHVQAAELKQAEVAELLDKAIKALVSETQ